MRRLILAAVAVSCFGVLIASANSELGTSAMPNPGFAGYAATDRAAITTFTGTVSVATLRCPAQGPRNINAEVQLFDSPSTTARSCGAKVKLPWKSTKVVVSSYRHKQPSRRQPARPSASG